MHTGSCWRAGAHWPRTSCHWSTADGSALFVASSRCQPGTELSIGDCGEGRRARRRRYRRSQGRSHAGHLTEATCTRRDPEGTAHPCAHASWERSRLRLRQCGAHLVGFISLHLAVVAHLVKQGAIKGHQRSSEAIRRMRGRSRAIRSTQWTPDLSAVQLARVLGAPRRQAWAEAARAGCTRRSCAA